MHVDFNKNGYDVYRCDECNSAMGRSPAGTGLPDGWTESAILRRHLCPRCTAKQEAKEAEREAKSWNNTPTGKKVNKGCGCLIVIFLVLFFLL